MSNQEIPCINHKSVKAVYRCAQCGVPLCPTCVIIFYGTERFCPKCASLNEGKPTPKQREAMGRAYIAAIAATLAFTGFWCVSIFMGDESLGDALASILGICILIASIVGVVYGFGSVGKNLKSPFASWASLLWNFVILGAYLILIVAGLLIGASGG